MFEGDWWVLLRHESHREGGMGAGVSAMVDDIY